MNKNFVRNEGDNDLEEGRFRDHQGRKNQTGQRGPDEKS